MARLATLPVLLTVLLVTGIHGARGQDPGRLDVDGTEFVLSRPGMPLLRGADLTGAVLTVRIGDIDTRVRIASVQRDPEAIGGPVWLHDLRVQQADGAWQPLCLPNAKDERTGFPLSDGAGGFVLTCVSGAEGKCVRWGYRPWDHAPDGTSLAVVHRACINMVRADYGGDDRPSTRDGMAIDVYDVWGIQKPENDPGFEFEAGWTPDGAVCVNHPRVAANIGLAELEARYPGLTGKTGPACTEATARALGAVLFNRSRP